MKKITTLFVALAVSAVFSQVPAQDGGQKTIVVYGATGKIGGTIVEEALNRGHRVIGVSRDPMKFTIENENFAGVQGDVTDPFSISETVTGASAVVVALSGSDAGNEPENSTHAIAAKNMIAVMNLTVDAPRVIQIGGATTMYGGKDEILANLPFPAEEGTPMYGMFLGHLVALDAYRASDIDWTVVTPPLSISGWREGDNTRTGEYRIDTDNLVMDADGKNEISMADLGVAVVDEIENGKYIRQRFTVGY